MKEWFLQPEDGEEFKVFYLGKSPDFSGEPNKEHIISWDASNCGISGCCPVGPTGHVGEKGEDAPLQDIPPLWDESAEWMPAVFPVLNPVPEEKLNPMPEEAKDKFMKKLFSNPIFKKMTKPSIEIDDIIPSDIVEEPVAGRIYKVLGLNMIVRFVSSRHGYHTDGSEFGRFELEYHNNHFSVNKDDKMLIKATEYETELYLNNEII
ncbi:hypothetical protein CL634_05830 [bacterium]|nr:hypothetical protein [bacterium]|tara:strand:+ start:239 stop:859 length:621 start_codon:yes stop_codon:yes gene_type:complete